MDRFDRIYELDKCLRSCRHPVPLSQIKERLECSRSTANRAIETLRDHLNAPLEYNRNLNGYYYNTDSGSKPYELPGLWFNDSELYALITTCQLLSNVEPGVLSAQIQPLKNRIETILAKKQIGGKELRKRIKIIGTATRPVDLDDFRALSAALEYTHSQYYLFIAWYWHIHHQGCDEDVGIRRSSCWFQCQRMHTTHSSQ